jgi:predicted component of type VI protein secretion system
VAYIERLDAGGTPTGERFIITDSALPSPAAALRNVTIGRDPAVVDIALDDATISRLHARIHGSAYDGYWLHDEGSAGGTYLNFERLGLAPRRLEHGDVIQFGRAMFRFVLAS